MKLSKLKFSRIENEPDLQICQPILYKQRVANCGRLIDTLQQT